MTLKQAVKILERHNRWRRGANIRMEHPKKLGEAIDTAINALLKQLKNT